MGPSTNKTRILFLSANPLDTPPLQLIKECKEIRESIKQARYANEFDFDQWHEVSLEELLRHIRDYNPHIIHFSGHGAEDGQLVFQDIKDRAEEARIQAIANLFKVLNERTSLPANDKIRCVVLNACFSKKQAAAIAKNVDCVVGMKNAVRDDAARVFAQSYYGALASGESVNDALKMGKSQIELLRIPGQDIPTLLSRSDIDASSIFLLEDKMVRADDEGAGVELQAKLSKVKAKGKLTGVKAKSMKGGRINSEIRNSKANNITGVEYSG
jgi:hypothetical protein